MYRLAWDDSRATNRRSYLRFDPFTCIATYDTATTFPTATDALRALVDCATNDIPALYGEPNWTANVFATPF